VVAAFILTLAAAASLSGVVHDSSGAVVVGASVIVRPAVGQERQTQTGPDGRFTIESPDDGDVTLIVRAGGFAENVRRLTGADRNADLNIQVVPAGVLETVTVTPTRSAQRLGDVPASVNVMTSDTIEASPALLADDVLRQVPTFSLFRRTSGLVANPTAQGVSLRGVGPSGQSRTLVLLDGIPFNDPFGGWVYWTRVPLVSVDRIEITEGPTSSLYGNIAMGGVINIITSRPSRRTLELKPQFGSRKSPKLDFFASDQWNKVAAAVEGSFLNTDGFPIVVPIERGPVDNNADVEYKNFTGKVEYTPSDRMNMFVRAGYFTEARVNGKVGEVNDTRWTTVNGGVRARLRDYSTVEARAFADVQKSHFNFLAVTNAATTRNVVRLATDQRVPTNGVGGMAQWTKAIGRAHAVSAGFDWRRVDADSEEDAFVAAVPTVIVGVTQAATLTVKRVSGGTQQSLGAFVQDVFTPVDKLVLTLSARVDRWRNFDGHNLETTVATGLPTGNNRPSIPDKNDTVVSPRAAALYHVTDRVSVWGAANSGFRAPTLTELYRQFSVAAVTTFPNSDLGPERLVGGELGLNVAPARNLTFRATWFDNRVKDPVANVTQAAAFCTARSVPAGCAQKQNLGKTRVRGIQTDVEYRIGTAWRVAGAYMRDDAKITDGGSVPALAGKFLQQVPKHRGSLQIAYSEPKVATVALGVQMVGLQFNDDLNTQLIPTATLATVGYDAVPAGLPGYAVVDFTVARDINRYVQAFFGVQNLLDKVYFVQTNPSTVGTPRMINGGVRVRLAGR
jgi:outer membrane receptor protein involved in Fe transport